MKVAEYAQKRMKEEDRSGNDQLVMYWRAYLDGCIAQNKEDVEAFKTLCREKGVYYEIDR